MVYTLYKANTYYYREYVFAVACRPIDLAVLKVLHIDLLCISSSRAFSF